MFSKLEVIFFGHLKEKNFISAFILFVGPGKRRQAFCMLFLVVLLTACSAPLPSWRSKVVTLVEDLGQMEATELFPQEYKSMLETFEHGEALHHVRKDDTGADVYYRLSFQKGEILKLVLQREKKRLEVEKQKQEAELAVKAADEQLKRAVAEAEIRLRARQLARDAEAARAAQKKNKDVQTVLPTSYTVRRGESLPQISARSEIYNDSTLWPIIYRANRDQIRDPKRLWPGQIFVIPRNFSRDEAVEARRYSDKNN